MWETDAVHFLLAVELLLLKSLGVPELMLCVFLHAVESIGTSVRADHGHSGASCRASFRGSKCNVFRPTLHRADHGCVAVLQLREDLSKLP